jgi:RNA polymerase sigma-70 factor, ECF subfamily
MTGQDDLAQDFTQDVFVRAFERLPEFRGESAFGTWLHTIATSVILNGMRRVRRFRERETELDDSFLGPGSARRSEPDLKERLARAIEALPEGCRTVFVMHDMEGYTHEEIGEALGVTSGTSKSHLSRARGKLRESLADFAREWIQ